MAGRRRPMVIGTLVALLLSACAGTPRDGPVPPERTVADVVAPDEIVPVAIYDPLERWNRGVYNFNAQLDRFVLLPLVDAYRFVTPEFVRDRFADFFSNVREIQHIANSLLQGSADKTGRAVLRFVVNTMFTLGFYDLAEARDIRAIPEDFGQTLGHWGVGPGAYLVLPVLGPSGVRDGFGFVVDTVAKTLAVNAVLPEWATNNLAAYAVTLGLQPIVVRDQIAFRYFETGSPFEYDLVRLLYTEKRKLDIAR